MENLVIYPILLQFITSITLMFLWRKIRIQKLISVTSATIGIFLAFFLFFEVTQNDFLVLNAGQWQAPYGISFAADTLSATLVVLVSLCGWAVSTYSTSTILHARLRFGFLPVFHFLLTGLYGTFLTADIFNMYVWFEIIIITSFVLLSLGGEKAQLEGTLKYFTLNIISSTFFLTALGALYGITGTLSMADLQGKVLNVAATHPNVVQLTGILFLIGFGTKAALFPVFYWLPASYHTPPAAVSAIFGGLLTKVGVYALLRAFTLIFPTDTIISNTLLILSVLTLVVGGMGALVQNNLVKAFAYLIICHIGFMILGLGMKSFEALTGTISYLIHDIVVKTNLFLVAGLIYKITGTHSLRDLGGLYKRYPRLALVIAVPLLAVVGVPPFSGFWPKISLIKASLEIGSWQGVVYIGAILFASFITLIVIAKIWAEVFWKTPTNLAPLKDFQYFQSITFQRKIRIILPILLLSVVTIYYSFSAETILQLSQRIASEIQTHELYIRTLLK